MAALAPWLSKAKRGAVVLRAFFIFRLVVSSQNGNATRFGHARIPPLPSHTFFVLLRHIRVQ